MRKLFFIFLLLFSIKAVAQHSSLTVVMIRHGEKNDSTGNLSCQGFNRSLALPAVLNSKFPTIKAIYVPSLSDKKITGHARMFQTITPFAVQYNIAINSTYAVNKDSAVARDVMTRKGVILLVWEHGNIPGIAKALGIAKPGSWNGSDFDSIWIVTYSKNKSGKWVAALTTQQEGLSPAATCN